MFLKVTPIKGVTRFNVKVKLSPKYIGPYEIIEKLNPAAYQLILPIELEHMHNVFQISQLRKYTPDASHTIEAEPIEIVEDLAYEERLVQILNLRIKQLHNRRGHEKQIPLVV